MAVYLNKQLIRRFDVYATEAEPQVYEGWVDTQGSRYALSVIFENDYYEPEKPAPHDRNLYVSSIEVAGPYPATMDRIIPREHTPEDKFLLAREIMHDLMSRAFRRPVTPEEVERVLSWCGWPTRTARASTPRSGWGCRRFSFRPTSCSAWSSIRSRTIPTRFAR